MIWCVEDDASIRDIELYALTSTGFEARGFDDGASFWEALQTETPELVLLDVMLPGEDGVSLLKKMKAAPALRDIPVIMATAKGAEYDKIQSLDLGADDYLVKPFGVMEMVSRVTASGSSSLIRSLSFCGCFCPIREWHSPGNSYSHRCGIWSTWMTAAHWICTSVPCGRS